MIAESTWAIKRIVRPIRNLLIDVGVPELVSLPCHHVRSIRFTNSEAASRG